MSHTINLYVLKKSSINDLDFIKNVPHTEENGYILLPLGEALTDKLKLDYMDDGYQRVAESKLLKVCPDMAWVETDYFGGLGDQSGKAWKDGKMVGFKGPEISINAALKAIGVERSEEYDEFDTIRLGMYRDNHQVVDKWLEITGKTIEKIQRRVVLRHIPKDITLYWMEERVYSSMFEYIAKLTMPGNTNFIKYYECVVNTQVKDVSGFDVEFFKETRKLTTEEAFNTVLPDAVSWVKVEYAVDTIYTFQKITSYPVGIGIKEVTSICVLDYQCDSAGSAMLHDQVKNQILFTPEFHFVSPFHIGLTGRKQKEKEVKKPLIKKTVEVYECPECNNGTLFDQDGLHCCNVCNYKVVLETA